MRQHIIYLSIIGVIIWLGFITMKKQRERIDMLNGNVSALVQDTTEKAARLILSKKELQAVSPKTADQVKVIEKKENGKVREIHITKWLPGSVIRDTVFIENMLCCDLQVFEFNHGCITNIVTYDPLNNGITDSLFGEITSTRYILAERPRWLIVKPRMWNKKNWPQSVRTENNCGFEIKENTIFEIK